MKYTQNKKDGFRLFSYKMTSDTGFAPNPFHGLMTLANCKPRIRKNKNIRQWDWVAGFTSTSLKDPDKREFYRNGEEKIIFLMKITEPLIGYADYWNEKEYECKRRDSKTEIGKVGDNIYEPIKGLKNAMDPADFISHAKEHHSKDKYKVHDINGRRILISKHFYYFGNNPREISPLDKGEIHPSMKNIRDFRIVNNPHKFIKYIEKNFKKNLNPKNVYPLEWEESEVKDNCSPIC